MKKLVVDAEGKVIIPAHILAKMGLRPGDELTLVEEGIETLCDETCDDSVSCHMWQRVPTKVPTATF